MSRVARWLLRLLLALLLLTVMAIGAGWWALRSSVPQLNGSLTLASLSASATARRDALGVVTVDAANEQDAARALGYVHGQERFFEMDLLRRSAAGELSELFGKIALDRDRSARVHRLRAMVRAHYGQIVGATDRTVLQAYADGVNAGRRSLRARPWPYLLLRAQPRDWSPEDCLLAGYAMFFDLQDESNSRELALWKIRQSVPPALYALIARDGSEWDAPLQGAARGNAPLPIATELDLRRLPMPAANARVGGESEPAAPGSNNFAVAGALTADHRAIVADDMHLGLRVPDIWFRARLRYADARAQHGRVDVSGFTLPGIPAVIVGSNGHVAWGFTNSYGDWLDFFRVHWTDASHSHYQSAFGAQALATVQEKILVKGEAPVMLAVRETIWGPITEELDNSQSLALRWSAELPGALNVGLAQFAYAPDLDSLLAMAGQVGMPAQNLVAGDSHGRIAWRVTGQFPRRVGNCDASSPLEPATCAWQGWRAASDSPALIDPPNNRLWTANARVADGAGLAIEGDSGYANGARARQIRDDLLRRPRFDERAMMQVQLDDRALFLERWYRLLRTQATNGAARNDPTWIEFEAATRRWDGRAQADSVSYRLVRAWRLAVLERIRRGLLAPAMARLGEKFVMPDLPQLEGVAWPMVTRQPLNLLPRGTASWPALFLEAARDVQRDNGGEALARRRWGERNRAKICHPLAGALPGLLRPLLCMPADELDGDANMPRVVGPSFGASERMVVSPGHEADGLVHMPGGQSGNPLSPYWGAGHEDWVHGRPTPFLPGPTQALLTLHP